MNTEQATSRNNPVENPAVATSQKLFNTIDHLPMQARELIAVLLLIILGDITIYRTAGYAGLAVFLTGCPLLIFLGRYRSRFSITSGCVAIMILVLAAKMIWLGSFLQP